MIRANQQCLEQALAMLGVLTDRQYADRRGDWSPVGAQYRHVVEHYLCFLDGIVAGRIDYDARRRDPTIEHSRSRADELTREIVDRLAGLAHWPADHPVSVQMQCHADATEPCWAGSTVGRELQFLVSHSVHHFALIKLLVASDGVPLDSDFGTAPSTVSHSRALR